jgi:endogenous inhibitor of DNA gyrase (YacG/DUF329 family)
MGLPPELLHAEISMDCPHCAHSMIRSGYWFKTVQVIKCPKCSTEIEWGYQQKVALFDKHVKEMKDSAR